MANYGDGGRGVSSTRPGVLGEWMTQQRAEGLAERTVAERARIVDRVARLIGEDVDAMTTPALLDYLARIDGAGTRVTYFASLAAWHRWLRVTGRRGDDPLEQLRRPRTPRRLPRPVSNTQLEQLLASRMQRRTRTMVMLAAYQGLRVHEIAKIRGEDIDLSRNVLRVVGKGGVDVDLPLHPLIADRARVMPDRGWWFPAYTDRTVPVRSDAVSTTIGRAMRRAGVTGSAHQLRHWLGTELIRSGADARTTQTLLRHASLATTAIYTQVDDTQRSTALRRLPDLTPDTPPAPTWGAAAYVSRPARETSPKSS